jgi:hypothetical protein
MSLPAPELYLHHTVTAEYADACAAARAVQSIAFGRGYSDISYSFLIHVNGDIATGRGWGVVGAHTLGHNSISHAFSLVGNFDVRGPTDAQILAVRWLTAEGKRLGKIGGGAVLQPHRLVFATACPGQHAVARLADFRVPYAPPPPAPPPPPPQPKRKTMYVGYSPEDATNARWLVEGKKERRWIQTEAERQHLIKVYGPEVSTPIAILGAVPIVGPTPP